MVDVDASGARPGLTALLEHLSTGLRTLSDALSTTYLSNVSPSVAPSRHVIPDGRRSPSVEPGGGEP